MAWSGLPSSSIGWPSSSTVSIGAVGEDHLAGATGAVAHRVVDQALDLEPVERLVLEQRVGDRFQTGAVRA